MTTEEFVAALREIGACRIWIRGVEMVDVEVGGE